MNLYYNHTQTKENVKPTSLPKIHVNRSFIEFICTLIAFFTCPVAIKLQKVIVIVVCFVCSFGIIGGIDNQSINWFLGILIFCGLGFVQFMVLRSVFSSRSDKG